MSQRFEDLRRSAVKNVGNANLESRFVPLHKTVGIGELAEFYSNGGLHSARLKFGKDSRKNLVRRLKENQALQTHVTHCPTTNRCPAFWVYILPSPPREAGVYAAPMASCWKMFCLR